MTMQEEEEEKKKVLHFTSFYRYEYIFERKNQKSICTSIIKLMHYYYYYSYFLK